jgi:hypothetical protein
MRLQDLQLLQTLQTLSQETRRKKQQGRNSDVASVTLFIRWVAEAKFNKRNQAADMTP